MNDRALCPLEEFGWALSVVRDRWVVRGHRGGYWAREKAKVHECWVGGQEVTYAGTHRVRSRALYANADVELLCRQLSRFALFSLVRTSNCDSYALTNSN